MQVWWDCGAKRDLETAIQERDNLALKLEALKDAGLRALNCEQRLLDACDDISDQEQARRCWAPRARRACEDHLAQFSR